MSVRPMISSMRKSVRDFFFQPGIAGHDGDAKDFGLRRLDQQQDRLLIGAPGPGRILIDDDLAFAGGLLAEA